MSADRPDIKIQFQLYPWYIRQTSGMEKGREWSFVVSSMEGLAEKCFGARPHRAPGTKTWEVKVDGAISLRKVVDFVAIFHSIMEGDYPYVGMDADVGMFSKDTFIEDIAMEMAVNAIEKRITSDQAESEAISTTVENLDGNPSADEPGPDPDMDDFSKALDGPSEPELEADIEQIREKLHRNQITDAGAIQLLCELVELADGCHFTREAFEILLGEVAPRPAVMLKWLRHPRRPRR